MQPITVFTPTYNRAFCLGQLYESLLRQTSKSFVWLIIDDGSTDNTHDLVSGWQEEGKIEIQYLFQSNQGMHSAHNAAYAAITTELNVCIDSDDYMPDDAIALILAKWESVKDQNLAGIIGLDAFKDNSLVGDRLPEGLTLSTLNDLYRKHGVKGDKKLVLRTAVAKQFPPYPIFPEERLVPLGVLYLMIDQHYQWACANQVYCIVEYLPDGSSKNILRQYRRSPKGFGYSRLVELRYAQSFGYAFSRAVHYVSSCLFQKKYDFWSGNPRKWTTLIALPFGLAFYFYLLYKTKK